MRGDMPIGSAVEKDEESSSLGGPVIVAVAMYVLVTTPGVPMNTW